MVTAPESFRRRTTAVLAAAAMAVGALALAACSAEPGGQAGGSPVASISAPAASASASGPLTVAQSDQDFIDFARCMRAHGVSEPDPTHIPGHSGLSIEVPPRTTANAAAWSACGHFIQPVVSMKLAGQASWAAASLTALTRYARCMRSHDIAMLDPTPMGQFVAEAALLAAAGGAAGAVAGAVTTTIYALARHWSAVIGVPVLLAAVLIALLIGGAAGIYPALRAARLAPAEALRIV